MMKRTTVRLPEALKAELKRMAAETGKSEANIIREGIRLAVAQRQLTPTIPIFISADPHFAERVEERLVGYGER